MVKNDIEQKEKEEKKVKLADMMLGNIIELGKFSFDLESKREESILTQTSQMLTSFSFITVVILMIIPIVFEHTSIAKDLILASFFIILIAFLLSFVLALAAQYRFKYISMLNIEDIYNEVKNNHKEYTNDNSFKLQLIDQIGRVHKSKKQTNDMRVKLVRASMICFLASIFLLVLFSLLIFILR